MGLCTSYNMPKAIIAVFQTISGLIILSQSRGDQSSLYGYASFGLTVTPYVIMSMMNLCAGVFLPEYPTVFIVLSEASDKAVAEGGQIDGAVGRLIEIEDERPEPTVEIKPHFGIKERKDKAFTIAVFIFGAIPFIVIGVLTHFKKGDSTTAQRVWTMMWLVLGILFGLVFEAGDWQGVKYDSVEETNPQILLASRIICVGLYGFPAIGGFVVVGQMMKAYGTCTLLS